MKSYKELLTNFDDYNPFPIFFENGYTPEIIKQEIIKSFDNYFENKVNLNENAINSLSATWISYLSVVVAQKHLIKKLDQIVNLTKSALKTSTSLTVQAYVDWSEDIYTSNSQFWSIKNLEKDTSEMSLEDMAVGSFQMIGQLLEGLIKPYIRFIYSLHKISNNELSEKKTITAIDFGLLIKELSESPNTILIQPENISLNQWRNIAYHHNYKIEKDRIKCTYGKGNNIKSIYLTRKKLLEITKGIFAFFKILKVSETIFVFDNLQDIRKCNSANKTEKTSFRDEAFLLDFYSSIGTQGFAIEDLVVNENSCNLTIKDLLDKDPLQRGIHTSQFLYNLWLSFSRKEIAINYKKKDGTDYMSSKISEKHIKLFHENKIKFSDLDKYIDYNFTGDSNLNENLKTIQGNFNKKDPFKIHLLTAVPSKQKFYSQQGEPLTAKQFIKDFTLGIFVNYLVFRHLGYKQGQLKINVGGDGSIVRTDDKHSFILQLPAIIKEKFIQNLIIICASDIIRLYEGNLLQEELISQGKDLHRFEMKIQIISQQIEELKVKA